MSLEERLDTIRSAGEECIQEDELLSLLKHQDHPICYDGFEPSGRMHIAQGVLNAINVKKLTSAGCRVKILLADLHAKLNNKMGGDYRKIETVGKYFVEIWKAMGMDIEGDKVEILWAREEINARPKEYWDLVTDIAVNFKIPRLTRCCEIMGLSEQDELTAAQIFYPCLQCADVFFLKADICQLGMDQREVNMLAREYCDIIRRESKPIILSHRMIPGLQQGQEKMSKTDSSSAIYMEDEEAEINVKIKKAYCPPKIIEGNPCIQYAKYLIFPWFKELTVERKAGGNKTYYSFEELVVDYETGILHPGDVKPGLSRALNKMLKPVRDHFTNDSEAKELLKKVKSASYRNLGPVPQSASGRNVKNAEATQSLSIHDASHCNGMPLDARFELVRSVGEECIQDDELKKLLKHKEHPICYDGFEPSGRMHIAQGVMKTINVNKLTSAGCRVKIWIADLFAKLNNKMGGDYDKIRIVGKYFIEIWKAVGMDIEGDKVEFLWCREEINARAKEYWDLVTDIASSFKATRLLRCCQIMGRSEQDELTAAQILYPCMQCADVFFLKADICQLGMDQRKVNMLAREYCDIIKRKHKPIILSHRMIPGLQQGQEKMSKTDSASAIYMEDEEDEVNLKIEKAYCPPKIVEGNPCLEYVKYLIIPWFKEFTVERNGGNRTYCCFEDLVVDYEAGALQPDEVKPALSKALNKILQPVRDHFTNNSEAKELLKKVKSYRVSR